MLNNEGVYGVGDDEIIEDEEEVEEFDFCVVVFSTCIGNLVFVWVFSDF